MTEGMTEVEGLRAYGPVAVRLTLGGDPMEVAREAVERAKSKGYRFAMLYMDLDEAIEVVDGDALGALRDDGLRVHRTVGLDVTRRDRGESACHFVMLGWGPIPNAAGPVEAKPPKAAKKPKRAKPASGTEATPEAETAPTTKPRTKPKKASGKTAKRANKKLTPSGA